MEQITFEILEDIGLIDVTPSGYEKRLKIIAWNGNMPKYDIRDWSPDGTKMSKGITLREEELKGLYELLKKKYEKV